MSGPDVSIVIAAYNAAATIPRAVAAALAQDFDGTLEVVVVDDGSTDETRAAAERAGARVVSQPNAGPAAARNRGFREARADVILFTDSDCVPHADWARLLTAGLDEDVHVVGGSYGIANPGRYLAELVHAEIRWRHSRLPDLVEFAGSFNLGARRAALEAVGGFDESFPAPSGEDNDLSYRLRDAGFAIRFVRDALVDHHHPEKLSRYLREQSRHGYWRMFLYAAHPGRMRGDGYAGPLDFATPPLAVVSVAFLLAAPFLPVAVAYALFAFAVVVALSEILAMQVARFTRSASSLGLAPVATLRAYARGWGLVRGLLAGLARVRGGAR
ncbi:MAG: glycosyltransferase [bacterium]